MTDHTRDHGSLPIDWTPTGQPLDLARYAIHCDAPGCGETAPQSDAVNFEIGGERMARALAEQNGWVRVRDRNRPSDPGVLRDYCPAHAPRRT